MRHILFLSLFFASVTFALREEHCLGSWEKRALIDVVAGGCIALATANFECSESLFYKCACGIVGLAGCYAQEFTGLATMEKRSTCSTVTSVLGKFGVSIAAGVAMKYGDCTVCSSN